MSSLTIETIYDDKPPVNTTIKSQALIGRSYRADIRLESDDVSRNHAEIFKDPNGNWWVRDMGSVNGVVLNDNKVQEARVSPGDVILLGDHYVLNLFEGKAETKQNNLSPQDSAMGMPSSFEASEPEVETSNAKIHTMDGMETPMVDTSHVHTLSEMGHRLSSLESDKDRMRLLCRTMVRKDFGAFSSMVLKVSKRTSRIPPEIMAEQKSPFWDEAADYISRSLLKAVVRTEAPALASNVESAPGSGNLNMSLSPETSKLAAIACPLGHTKHSIEMLYAVLPPHYGTAQWLALAALAVKQYEQAVTFARVREEAQQNAAMQHNINTANEIEKSLLAPLPSLPGIDFEMNRHECKWVGGDMTEVGMTPDGKLVILSATCQGTELKAALIKLKIHCIFQALVQSSASLIDLLTVLSSQFRDQSEGQTAQFSAISIHGESGAIECINGSYPPLLVVLPDGQAKKISSKNAMLGQVDPIPPTLKAKIAPGTWIACASPGMTELKDAEGNSIGASGITDIMTQVCQTSDKALAAADQMGAQIDRMEDGMLRQVDRSLWLMKYK